MKVLLANPPWLKKGYYGVRAGSRWPHFENEHSCYVPYPFFLGYSTALLLERGHEAVLLDACASREDYETFYRRVLAETPEVVLLEVSTISIANDLLVARELRRRLGRNIRLGFAGLHSFMYTPAFLEGHPDLDFILIGEYELPLLGYIEALSGRGTFGQVPGLIVRHRGKILATPRGSNLHELDLLPWPCRDQVDLHLYNDTPGGIPSPSLQLWSSRGCPFGCIFCAWPQIIYGERRYRSRDPHKVVDELEAVVSRYSMASFYFDDDTFNIGRPRVLALCEELLRRGLTIPWAAMCRADLMDAELLERLAGAGLRAVKYGVENATQTILDGSGKRLDLDHLRSVVASTKAAGILTHLTFMFGLPGETYDSARRTIDLALELDPYTLQFTIATPFPGSDYHAFLEQRGLLVSRDHQRYDGFHSAVIRTESLGPEELMDLLAEANHRWRRHLHRRAVAAPDQHYDVDCSLIVVNHNGAEVLPRCLGSLVEQTHPCREILLIDNGSTDGSAEAAAAQFPEVKVLRFPSNRGYSRAVNIGIRCAKGKYLGLINNDASLEPHWLEVILGRFSREPETGLIASRILYATRPELINSAGDGVLASGYVYQRGNHCRDDEDYDQAREVLGACGAALAVRAHLFNDIGTFDETFGMYLDDIDFSLRARLWGYRCIYEPRALVYHVGSHTTGSFYNNTNVFYIAKNNVNLIIKNFPRELLRRRWPSILLHFFRQQGYHTLRSGHGLAYSKGLLRGLLESGTMLTRRRHILGGKRIEYTELYTELDRCAADYEGFRRHRQPLWLSGRRKPQHEDSGHEHG
ncbi:MAG: hypothetical protein A2284_16700 [Deltaproteobacteria bacterium RIFOXYA12_FULL_61_11]|nr:MAG: hypothetical protein A2284_16700 [Deltaproteobacteria bacterium RIFOXYA12_FULL_61_11]